MHSIYVLDTFALTPSLVGWAFVVNVLWDLELYALGVSFLWVIWTLLL